MNTQSILTSYKTTIVGLLTGGSISIDAIIHQGITQGWQQALLGLGVIILGALAKDADVSTSTTDGKIVTNIPKIGISTPVINTTAPNKPIV